MPLRSHWYMKLGEFVQVPGEHVSVAPIRSAPRSAGRVRLAGSPVAGLLGVPVPGFVTGPVDGAVPVVPGRSSALVADALPEEFVAVTVHASVLSVSFAVTTYVELVAPV